MYEEDRVRALEEYEDIFEQAGNENAVLQLLVSPTRQAVNLARAYDAKDRGSLSEGGEGPAYLTVIDDLRRQAGALMPAAPVLAVDSDDSQISLFDKPDVADSVFNNLELGNLPELEEDELPEIPPEEIDSYPDEDRGTETLSPPVIPDRTAQTEETPNREVEAFSDAVDAFLADFTVRGDSGDGEAPYPAQFAESKTEERPAPTPAPVLDHHDEDRPLSAEMIANAQNTRPDVMPILPDLPPQTKKKASVPLLILYSLIAIPITLLLIVLLLVPAALCLGLAAAGLSAGFAGVVEAFTAFSVFADMLLVFGLALAIAAFGLLLFWCFVWFLVGAIPGLIRGACRLGGKLCYREVPV